MKYPEQRGRILLWAVISSLIFSSFLPSFSVKASTDQPAPTEGEVLVVYNSSYVTDSDANLTQDSQQIAEYYRSVRPGIPLNQVVGLAMPLTEEITWAQYNSLIKTPLETYLTTNNLDDVIKIIVTVKGVPLKIMGDDGFHDPFAVGCSPSCPVNFASVDAGISLSYQDFKSTTRHTNPYYNTDPTFAEDNHFKLNHFTSNGFTLRYLVSRLDGYTLDDVIGMIDRGVAADTTSSGYWVLDSAASLNYPAYATANTRLQSFHKNTIYDPYPGSTYITTSVNPIMGYSSMGYLDNLGDGYISNNPANPNHFDFDLLNGAVISTWESFTAYGFLNPDQYYHGQVAEWISIGGSGGIGNVYEPYTTSLARDEIWMTAYAIGYPWIEAAYMSMPKMGYVQVVVGDPLMVIADNVHPSSVSNFQATGTDGQIALSWTNPVGGDYLGTKVVRKTGSYPTSASDGSEVYSGTGTSYTNSGLTNGITYYYAAFAFDTTYNYSAIALDSKDSDYAHDSTAPGSVTNLAGTNGTGLVNLHWDNPVELDLLTIKLVRKTGSYPVDVNDGTLIYSGLNNSYLNVGLVNGTTYYYAAFAQDTSLNYSALSSGSKLSVTLGQSSGGGGGGGSSGGGGGGGGGSSPAPAPIVITPVPVEVVPAAPVSQVTTVLERITLESKSAKANELTAADQLSKARIMQKYRSVIDADSTFDSTKKDSIVNYICNGTDSTRVLGEGERAGVLNSYLQAYGVLPDSESEWSDALKIAHGRWPSQRSASAEQRAFTQFRKVYGRDPNLNRNVDYNAVMVIAYGLLPAQRNIQSEQAAIKSYRWVYGAAPRNALSWNIVRAIAYSGAKR